MGGGFCYGQDGAYGNKKNDERRSIDERRSVDEVAAFNERDSVNERYITDTSVYVRDVYQRFGEYVDDVYIVGFRQESYINAHILFENYDIDIGGVFKNFAIGIGVIIITAVLIPQLLPTLPTKLVFIVSQFPKADMLVRAGLVNAAIGAGINGTVSYVKSGGDLDATLNGVLTGAGEGFKWGVIAVSATSLAHAAVQLDKIKFISTRNADLNGKVHPISGVPYREELIVTSKGDFFKAVLAQFKSVFNLPMFKLPESLILGSREEHNIFCTTELYNKYISKNPDIAKFFTERQLEQIRTVAETGKNLRIDGLTWHHTGTRGQMQLVDTEIHVKTGHTGGFEIWGQGGLVK